MRVTHRRRLHSGPSLPARRRRGRLAAAAAILASLLTAATVGAAGPAQATGSSGSLKVMTRNLYLGADLTPALRATDPTSFLTAVATIYGTAQYTNFPARAQGLAEEIRSSDADLIALQEVSIWDTSGPGVPPSQDFLAILQAALAKRGLHYSVAAVSENANIGPIPLVSPCGSATVGDCLVTLKDRDVILVNDDTPALDTWGADHGNYTAQQTFTPPVPGAPSVSFNRGWASIEGRYGAARFHFVNTHLETEDFPAVQEAEVNEFLAGPARSGVATVIAGDFNSAADGSTTKTYSLLDKQFSDSWSTRPGVVGYTCCQNQTLTNPESQLATRIDLVMGRRGARPLSAQVIGANPFQATPPLYTSDHAGVVASFNLDDN